MAAGRVMFAAALALTAGCFGHAPYKIGDPDPDSNIPAMESAARARNEKAVGPLVQQLNSDDPAVRFYAIEALHRLTGQTFGYRYYDEDDQRKIAVRQWQQWLKARMSK